MAELRSCASRSARFEWTLSTPLAELRRVRVGSTNEPKLDAVRNAFAAYAPDVEVAGVDVPSGVPEQPVGWEEIVRGARNRARLARASEPCDLGVGLEDGLVALPDGEGELRHLNVGCAAIAHGERVWLGFSSGFAYPPECTEPAVRDRAPIGSLFDRLWEQRRGEALAPAAARTMGNVGKLTLGVLPRSEYTRHAVLCALVALIHGDLYNGAGARA
jgi:inosine/xanthosine triphosphatase